MAKTPISILQEAMDTRHKAKPRYEDTPCDLIEYRFKCVVEVDGITAAGYGSTKQAAKQKSAEHALQILGYFIELNNNNNNNDAKFSFPPRATITREFVNYVGKLNELASSHSMPYAIYIDDQVVCIGQFTVHCKFSEWTAKGCGATKKIAKQESAKNMLDLLKTKEIPLVGVKVESLGIDQMENINKLTEEVLKRFEKLPTISKVNEISEDRLKLPIFMEQISSLDALKELLEKRGHKCTVSIFQKKPVVLMMRLEDTESVIMGCGITSELASQDLLQMASLMLSNGYSFNR